MIYITDKDYKPLPVEEINMIKKLWNRFVDWIWSLLIDEYEVTIYFPAKVETKDDGTKVSSWNPKTYICRKIKIKDNKNFLLKTIDKRTIRINTVQEVGYDVVKTK